MALLDSLNDRQREAAETVDGPVLIIASAGSGKTNTITHRAAHIVQSRDVDPSRILLVTFTNKAANEMKERVHNLAGQSVEACTFHSLCYRLVSKHYGLKILDADGTKTLMKKILKDLNPNKQVFMDESPHELISWHKDTETVIEDPELLRIYNRYQEELDKMGYVDFSDVLLHGEQIIKELPSMYDYVHVDEYQDVNTVQFRLSRSLSPHNNLCVVGDFQQNIYNFRGADPKYIAEFENNYPNCKKVILETNYRSVQPILNLATNIISSTTSGPKYQLKAQRTGTNQPIYKSVQSDFDEANFIVNRLKLHHANTKYSDMAILVRAGWVSGCIEEVFRSNRIPYTVVGTQGFYDRSEIKDIIALIRYAINDKDYLAFERIITSFKGVGSKSAQKYYSYKSTRDNSLVKSSIHPEKVQWMWTATGALRDNSQAKGKDIRRVFESIDLPSFLNMKYPKDYEDRYKRVWTFIDSMIKYNETIEQILSVLALVSSNDEWDEKFDRVPIITCHAAKGLEWKVVFLPGISEGLFPYYRAEDDDAIDEERRLFYVACTRAKDNLYILHSEYRRAFGQGKTYEPSRFLNEVGLEQRKPKYLNVKEKIEYGIQSPNNEAVSGLAYWF